SSDVCSSDLSPSLRSRYRNRRFPRNCAAIVSIRAGWASGLQRRSCFIDSVTKELIRAVLAGMSSWPEEDQEELAEIERGIEARREGLHVLSDDERAGIEEA